MAKISKNKEVIIVWAGAVDGYKVHITDSGNVPHSSLCKNEPVRNLIQSPAEMAKILVDNGISPDKTIVVYDEGFGKYAGSMYWLLKYLGAPNVKMLNGNMTAWKMGRNPITGSPTKLPAATFTAKADAAQLATMNEVKKAKNLNFYSLPKKESPVYFSK